MRLEFCTIKIRDFKDYRGLHVLDLSELGLGLQYMRGENHVDKIGSNGAGKSSIWDAFLWALTGRTTRGIRGVGVRTWGGDEDAKVSVGFYKDADWHVVRRSTAKNGLWLDGKLTSQEEIDRTVGLSIVNIPHTILLGQKRELFFDLQPSQKLSILSETLGLDKWDVRSKRAKDKTDAILSDLTKGQFQLAALEKQRDELIDQLRDFRRQAGDWENDRSKGADVRDKKLKDLKKARERTVTEMGTHDLAYDGAETELRACRRDLKRLGEEADAIRDRLMKARTKRATLKAAWNDLRDMSESDVCPTCGQTISAKHKHAADAKKKLKDARAAHEAASERQIEIEKELEEKKDAIEITRNSERAFGQASDDAKDKLDQFKAQIADMDKQMAVIKAQDRSDEENPHTENVRKCRKTIQETKALIIELKNICDKLDRWAVRTKYWIDGFRQVRLYLLQEMLEELQEVTQNILPDVGLAGWIVEYDIEREKKDGSISTGLNVRILKPGMDKAVKWEAWSGGENQRLLIVGALALSEVLLRHAGIECDMLVLDEPTRHMSREGVSDLVEHLLEIANDKQIFYCDHAVVENKRFANVLTIKKDGDGSQIKIEA